jgi:hypothetical protein
MNSPERKDPPRNQCSKWRNGRTHIVVAGMVMAGEDIDGGPRVRPEDRHDDDA